MPEENDTQQAPHGHLIRGDEEAIAIVHALAAFLQTGRNGRVHTLHDPVRWKSHLPGNRFLNGKHPPRHDWN